MAGWYHRLDGHEFEWTPGVGDGEGGLVCCNSWGRKESDTIERLNWAELNGCKVVSHCSFSFFKIYFWLCWVFIAVHVLSLVVVSGGTLCGARTSHCDGFSCCREQELGHVGFSSCSMSAQQLWYTGLVALQHVRSSRIREQSGVPCIGRWIISFLLSIYLFIFGRWILNN